MFRRLSGFLLPVFVLLLSVSLISLSFASAPDSLLDFEPLIPDDIFSDPANSSPVVPLAVSGYNVYAFTSTVNTSLAASTTVDSTNLSAGTCRVKSLANGTSVYGYRITIPASSVSGHLFVYGIFPAYYYGSAYSSFTTASGYPMFSLSYILSPSPVYPVGSYTGLPTYSSTASFDGVLYIPAHTASLYLYVYASANASSSASVGATALSSSFVTFVADVTYTSVLNTISSNTSTIASHASSISSNTATANTIANNTLSKITSIDNQIAALSSSLGPSAMDKFEDNYITKAESQLNDVEDAIFGTGSGPLSSLAPNDGYTGFASDVSEGFGFSGDSFNPSEFSSALNQFSGSSAVGPGGPWEFFSQSVSDELSGGSGVSAFSASAPPDQYIYDWLSRMEERMNN